MTLCDICTSPAIKRVSTVLGEFPGYCEHVSFYCMWHYRLRMGLCWIGVAFSVAVPFFLLMGYYMEIT